MGISNLCVCSFGIASSLTVHNDFNLSATNEGDCLSQRPLGGGRGRNMTAANSY